MSTAPQHHGGELIPRPEKTPDALRAALAVVAPDRLDEMQADLNKAFAEASRENSITPVKAFVIQWATVVEIERHPERAREFHRAEYLVQIEDDDVSFRKHMTLIATTLREAQAAVQE
ncbi:MULTISPECIES: DUF6247 family protein [unclassified Kitasatospora]|uniref:DUF6247 family protein n=1 Tax=unclassified Kitasatospora TaxID=2633591 RepID=UPI0007110DAC|nr:MULTISPECIES: DUF6247 family protein [unclassified Kitasatospora]KQV03337.1 hypothetical protein ASC99_16125 [Kitasatospora sp. Root107]KRB66078.1 hypothetical protein ASE03_31345 [Kitasatospora sp. Root187]